ncbi:sporulation protein [Bacillus aquiflavi]|uniref:Sporulation protein n=1 Tax=Bacillus aquiflavi TaxID=2672567 RepID=A0A6B3W0M8_9BACI|nr:sporulation membrane protein YtrI [Bacillus aquiflavi]MBA4537114.1 sporulation protein [Bacillus aquiflavi]NEY81411.1 sporulation protein [Bacillus aquiflavi]UAC47545.1 sporulation protein [Bacillus aquiflavi]
MRIPPFYHNPVWQRFLTGIVLGSIISWVVFLFIYGSLQENQTKLIRQQEDEIRDLKENIKIWQEEFKALNKKNEQKLTVQDIKVQLVNGHKYKLDSFSIFEIEEKIKEDVSIMIAKDLDTVYKSRDLFKKMIENKVIKVNDKRYRLEVKEIVVYTSLLIQLVIHLDG